MMVGRIQRDGSVRSLNWPIALTPTRLCQDLPKFRVCLALLFWFRSSSALNTILPDRLLT